MNSESATSKTLAYWGDDGTGPTNGEAGARLLRRVMDIATRYEASNICDLGCGNGYLAAQFGRLGYRVIGIDASERKLAIAREHYQSDRVSFRHGIFGEQIASLPESVDLAVSVDVIEHLYRPMSLIETVDAILKPGGYFVVCTPYHGYLKNLAISVLNRWDSHHHVHFDGGHIKFFSVATLSTMLRARLDVIGVNYYGRLPGLWKNMILVARKRNA